MTRHRIITRTTTAGSTSETHTGAILSIGEAQDMLGVERALHDAGGWTTAAYGWCLVCMNEQTIRTIWIQARDPFSDSVEGGASC